MLQKEMVIGADIGIVNINIHDIEHLLREGGPITTNNFKTF